MAIKGVRCAGMMLWAGLLGFLLVAALGLSTASGAVSPAPFGAVLDVAPVQTPVVGEPCGHGAKLSPWVVCLHGVVLADDGSTALSDVEVEVTLGAGRTVTDVTSSRYNADGLPAYGIDISVITPTYLAPITLTARLDGSTVARQVLVFPDYRTHNQRVDLLLPKSATEPAPGLVWGYVYDYTAGGPVAAAKVTLDTGSQTFTGSTAVTTRDPQPIFAFATPGLALGQQVTLTAEYNGLSASGVLAYPGAAVQANLLIGWPCDTQGILPQGGGQFGLPQGGGQFGLPDEACIWGYGLLDGKPAEGILVELQVDDDQYHTTTRLYPSATAPIFALRVPGASQLKAKQPVLTSSYRMFTSTQAVAIAGDIVSGVRADVSLASLHSLGTFTGNNRKPDIQLVDGRLWAASPFGVIAWNPADGSYITKTVADGLLSNNVKAIGAEPSGDTLWFGSDVGVNSYTQSTGQWRSYTATHGLSTTDIDAIVVDVVGDVWVGGPQGASLYSRDSTTWFNFPAASGPPGANVMDIALSNSREAWFASNGDGISRYRQGVWSRFTTANSGLLSDHVSDIAVDSMGRVWAVSWDEAAQLSTVGLTRYDPAEDSWTAYLTEVLNTPGPNCRRIDDVRADSLGQVWVVCGDGVVRFEPETNGWYRHLETNGVTSERLDMELDENSGTMWFGTESCGVERVQGLSSQFLATPTDILAFDDDVAAIANDVLGQTWLGTSCNGLALRSRSDYSWHPFTLQEIAGVQGVGYGYPVYDIEADDKGAAVWVAGPWGTSKYDVVSGAWSQDVAGDCQFGTPWVTALREANGELWIGTASGLYRYDTASRSCQSYTAESNGGGLASNFITSLDVRYGAVWVATHNGLSRFDLASSSWETYTVASTGGKLISDDLSAVKVAHWGGVWLGTNGHGIVRYEPEHAQWMHYQFGKDPYSSEWESPAWDWVTEMAEDYNDDVWFASGEGLIYYNRSADTVQPWRLRDRACLGCQWRVDRDVDGDLWFALGKGVEELRIPGLVADLQAQIQGSESTLTDPRITVYTVTVNNIGQRSASATALTLSVPPGAVTYVSDSIPSQRIGEFTWDLGALEEGASPIVFTVSVKLLGNIGDHLVVTATALTDSPEILTANNTGAWSTRLRDARPDVRIALVGPPSMTPGADATFTVWVDNVSGLVAHNTSMTLLPLPPGLTAPNPPDFSGIDLAQGAVISRTFTVRVGDSVSPGTRQTVTVQAATEDPETALTNNEASATLPVGTGQIDTLILVAGEQMAHRLGHGASGVLPALYRLARHAVVNGAVVDVQQASPDVAAAYARWNAGDLSNQELANEVAAAIKAVIDDYVVRYPDVRYIVFVGGDDVIPFYRVSDATKTYWPERRYYEGALSPSGGTVRAALAGNYFLTDDFYTDRITSTPSSVLWPKGNRPLYQPDFASGRLVETPEEILAAITAFTSTEGLIEPGPVLAGADEKLTLDSVNTACAAWPTCTEDSPNFRNEFTRTAAYRGYWSAQHSNHRATGDLGASDIRDLGPDLTNKLLLSIGCHSGLNVPASEGDLPQDYDLIQAFLGKGGVAIAPTAYAYATAFEPPSYAEEFLIRLTEQLRAPGGPYVGVALMQAKHRYLTDHADALDALDEKSVLPITLYGLPMWQMKGSGLQVSAANMTAGQATQPGLIGEAITHEVEFQAAAGTLRRVEVAGYGVYYDYAGRVLVQDGRPIQPEFQITVPVSVEGGKTPHGVILRRAAYTEDLGTEEFGFDPVIALAWAIGEQGPGQPSEPAWPEQDWDWDVPYHLGYFPGLSELAVDSQPLAVLNFVLGAFKGETKRERLFNHLALTVLYSDSGDQAPPTVPPTKVVPIGPDMLVTISPADADMTFAVAVCDDGERSYETSALTQADRAWIGACPANTQRAFVQVGDAAGNVANGPWTGPTPPFRLYLPLIGRP